MKVKFDFLKTNSNNFSAGLKSEMVDNNHTWYFANSPSKYKCL